MLRFKEKNKNDPITNLGHIAKQKILQYDGLIAMPVNTHTKKHTQKGSLKLFVF